MVHIALLLLIYVTAPPFGPRLTTTKLGEDHFRTTGQIPENPGPIDSKIGGSYTPLMGINYRENAEVANILCKSGASLKIRNHNNMSPMEVFLESNKRLFKLIVCGRIYHSGGSWRNVYP